MNMVKSRLLGRNTLSSTVIGVIPKDPSQQQEVSKCTCHLPLSVYAVILFSFCLPCQSLLCLYPVSVHPVNLSSVYMQSSCPASVHSVNLSSVCICSLLALFLSTLSVSPLSVYEVILLCFCPPCQSLLCLYMINFHKVRTKTSHS